MNFVKSTGNGLLEAIEQPITSNYYEDYGGSSNDKLGEMVHYVAKLGWWTGNSDTSFVALNLMINVLFSG